MAFVKIAKGKYKNIYAIKNVLTYIWGKEKENKTPNNIFGALGVDCKNIDLAICQFEKLQRSYRKEAGKRILHIIVSFSEQEAFTLRQYLDIGYDIANFFGKEYQVFFGLHENHKNQLHIHFAVNPVNVYTGKKIHLQKQNIVQLKEYVNQVILKYQIKSKKNYELHFWENNEKGRI